MTNRMLRISCLLSLGLIAGGSAFQYVVSPSGNDAVAAGPWKTIQKAATTAIAGDTVVVDSGTYVGFVCESHSGTSAKAFAKSD